jgi:gliding motility-associated-like protein
MHTDNALNAVPGGASPFTSSPSTSPHLLSVLNSIGSPNSQLNDLSALQFSFLAAGDSIEFEYIFASNEYSGYTCTQYNDVFGFILIGQGINGAPLFNTNGTPKIDSVNIASIPGTTIPVAINTINGGAPTGSGTASICAAANPNYVAHSVYFNSNSALNAINFNGFTDVFKAKAGVVCGYPYTIKLLIADAFDGAFNSAVFLGARSFKLPEINLTPTTNAGASFTDTVMVEGCARSYLLFERKGATSDTLIAQFNYVGSAVPADFAGGLPDSLVLYPGQNTDTLWFQPVDDGVAEPLELLRVRMMPVSTDCAVYPADSVDIWIRDRVGVQAALAIDQGNDTLACPGSVTRLRATLSGGEGNRWGYWESDTLQTTLLTVAPPVTTTFRYLSWDECSTVPRVDSITIYVEPYDSIRTESDTLYLCPGDAVTLRARAQMGKGQLTTKWINGPTDTLWTVTPAASQWYRFRVTDNCLIAQEDSVYAWVVPSPVASFTYLQDPGNPLDVGFTNFSTDTLNVRWYFGDGDTSSQVHPRHVYGRPGTYWVGLAVRDTLGCSDSAAYPVELKMDHYVYIPSAFTPNNDAVNERFTVVATGIERMEWAVFNRWGLQVFHSSQDPNGWNGTYGGERVPAGPYSYRVFLWLPDGLVEERRGMFTVFR